MSEQQAIKMFLDNAGGDPLEALRIAVKCLAVSGHCISAGFIRKSPYDHINPPEARHEPLDA